MKGNGKNGKAKTANVTAKPPLVPQANGKGALYAGGVPGNAGGPGRPASVIRATCRGAFAERVSVLEAIADGAPVQKVEVPLIAVLAHAACPKCGGKLDAKDPATLAMVSVDGRISASPKERTHAVDVLGKYGLDARTQLAVDDVKERLRNSLGIIRQEVGPDLAERIINRIKGEWAA